MASKENELNQWKAIMDAQAGQDWQNNPIYKVNADWYQSELGKLNKSKNNGLLSNLGSIGEFIANDTNNLDTLSFATDKGLKVNLSNNRNKELGEPKIKLEDMDFSGLSSVGGNINTQYFDDQLASDPAMLSSAIQPRWEGNVQNDAASNFIKANTAQVDFEPYYLPLGDGEEWYVESREEDEFLKNSTIAERTAYTSMNPEEAAAFLANRKPPKNRFGHEMGYEEPLPTGMDALYPELETELSTQMPLLEQEDRDVFVTDDAEMIKTDLTAYEEAILDGDMDLARDIRLQGNADNYQRYEELKLLYPNQGLTSQYYPDVDYSHPNLIAQLKRKNDENLGDVFDLHNPFDWTIGYADNKENKYKYDVGGDTGLLEYAGVDLREDEIANVNEVNKQKLLSSTDDSLIEEDMFLNRYGFTRDDMTNLGEEDEVFDHEAVPYEMELMDDGEFPDLPEVIEEEVIEDEVSEVLSEDPEIAETQIAEEEVETATAAAVLTSDNYRNEDGTSAPEEAKNAADEVIDGDDDDEVKESKLSGIFGWLTDLFGVDDKSLLRAFVKYVGGRLFGLSSGKAAAFAWKGIEQDMATEAAKGAEARKWQDNMDEYSKQYDAAMAAGDTELAGKILRKIDDSYGIDRTEAEKYYDNIEFLESKLAQAIADGDKPEMVKAITAQLKRYREGGIDGTNTIKEPYDLNIQDENGNEKRVLARNGVNGREIQNPDGSWTPLTEYKHPDPDFGKIIHSNAVNKSDSGAVPFKMAGQRYNQSEDEKFEAEIDAIDADLEAGKIDEVEAYNRRSVVQNNNNNRNEHGELYRKKIPYATGISDTGVVYFPQFKGDEKKSAYQLGEGVRGLAKLKAIQSNPKAMAQVTKWNAQWESIATSNATDFGAIRSFISKKYRANPLQQAYYMGMLQLTTSKLRRDTGAAYNTKEMYDTMYRFANFSDTSGEVTSMKLDDAEADLEIIAGMTRSGQYLLGLMDGTYRPSNAWQSMMGNIYTMMESEGVYTSDGDGNDGSSTRNFEDEYPG